MERMITWKLGRMLGLWGATEDICGRDLQKADQLSRACQQEKEEMCSNGIKYSTVSRVTFLSWKNKVGSVTL